MEKILQETILMIALVILAGWILWLVFRTAQLRSRERVTRSEAFNKLVDKFGTAKEFAEFTSTEEGRKLLSGPATTPPNPLARVLRYFQAGILFVLLGAACFINAARMKDITEAQNPVYYSQMMSSFTWGTIMSLIGVGFILIAAVTHYLLRRWHLVNGSK